MSVSSINFTQQYTLLNNNLGLLSPFKPFRHGIGVSENISLPQGNSENLVYLLNFTCQVLYLTFQRGGHLNSVHSTMREQYLITGK